MQLVSVEGVKRIDMTTELIPREKCRVCKIYLAKDCLNDICLECSKKQIEKNN